MALHFSFNFIAIVTNNYQTFLYHPGRIILVWNHKGLGRRRLDLYALCNVGEEAISESLPHSVFLGSPGLTDDHDEKYLNGTDIPPGGLQDEAEGVKDLIPGCSL